MATTQIKDQPDMQQPGLEESLVLMPAVPSESPRSLPARIWVSLIHAERLLYTRILKRVVDILVASLALLLASPLLLIVALLIRLDSPGPALFRQRRSGRHGQPFTIFKFRTMTNAPGEEFMIQKGPDGQWHHKIPDDPRVTRIGKWLRRLSIDELPQLLNIVAGQMSLIGPRPELVQIVARYEPWQHRRHSVRPGLTGWWQVSGRSDCPMHENTELDLYYVDNISPWLDLRIAVRTIGVVLKGIGAF